MLLRVEGTRAAAPPLGFPTDTEELRDLLALADVAMRIDRGQRTSILRATLAGDLGTVIRSTPAS